MFVRFIFLLQLFSLIVITGCSDGSDSDPVAKLKTPPSDCFWSLEFTPGHDEARNSSWTDLNAAYWTALYRLPEDASHFTVENLFPYSRYMSLTSYQLSGEIVDFMLDKEIAPDFGSTNPFLPGNARYDPSRIYTVAIKPEDSEQAPSGNTMSISYGPGALTYRVYLPDNSSDAAGRTGLPRVTLYMSDGGIVQGEEVCDVMSLVEPGGSLPSTTAYSESEYADLRAPTDPAQNPPIFRANYIFQFIKQCDFKQDCSPIPAPNLGYALPDPRYLYSFISRTHGEILVLRGKSPETPTTSNGEEMAIEGQLRYWSLCSYEFYSSRAEACLNDEKIHVNEDGYYTVVISRQEDLPENATSECGVSYLGWPENGDGFGIEEGRDNYNEDGFLLLRHIVPSEDFAQVVPNIDSYGEEKNMGDYLPRGTYFTKAGFEGLGCNAWLALPYNQM